MKKVYNIINKLYGILMMISFWGGLLPIIPFIIALIIGGHTGEAISIFLYEKYYPWVIVLASIAILLGLVAMYLKGETAFTLQKKNKQEDK